MSWITFQCSSSQLSLWLLHSLWAAVLPHSLCSVTSGFTEQWVRRPFRGQLRPNPRFSPISLPVTDPINPTTGPLHIQITFRCLCLRAISSFRKKKNTQNFVAQRITFYGGSYVNIFVWLRNRVFEGVWELRRIRSKEGSKHFGWCWLHFKFR